MNRLVLVAAAALALAACERADQEVATNVEANQPTAVDRQLADGGAAAPVGAAAVRVASKEPYGDYLVDGGGRALYVLEGSRREGRQQAEQLGQRPDCAGECLAEWPLFLTEGAPTAGPKVDAGQVSTIARPEGQQVSYAGWPLYYYVGDRGPGSTSGQDYHDRWGGWYLLSPAGERIEGREMGPSAE
jgi:predicted lipoprotein with Yx(FWY)xxD motif